MFFLNWGYSATSICSRVYSHTNALHCSMARAEQVWLQDGESECTPMASPALFIHTTESRPNALVYLARKNRTLREKAEPIPRFSKYFKAKLRAPPPVLKLHIPSGLQYAGKFPRQVLDFSGT